MFLAHLLLSFCLLSGTPICGKSVSDVVAEIGPIQQSLETIRRHRLEIEENRIAFLNDVVKPVLAESSRLNEEMQALATRISFCDTEEANFEQKVTALGEELNEKMAALGPMLPILQAASRIDFDFERIGAILEKQGALDPVEQAIVLRVASLCVALDSSKI